MSDAAMTSELLARALVGLEKHPFAKVEGDHTEDFLRAVADAAVPAISVTLTFLLTKRGAAALSGFGSFTNNNGSVEFEPSAELTELASLVASDDRNRAECLAQAFLLTLDRAAKLARQIDFDLSLEHAPTTPEEEILRSIFGEDGSVHVREAARRLIKSLTKAVESHAFEAEQSRHGTRALAPPAMYGSGQMSDSRVEYTDEPKRTRRIDSD